MYGFAPGLACLGGLPEELAVTRRATPRPPHPANALRIGGGLAAVGTVPMPPGWYVVGRTPERLYAPHGPDPFPVAVGDTLVVMGPQNDFFSDDRIAAFLAGPWTVATKGDRMACFLYGMPRTHAKGDNIVSDGIARGAIQVPGEGRPIVPIADRQSTGGYPKIATVIGRISGGWPRRWPAPWRWSRWSAPISAPSSCSGAT